MAERPSGPVKPPVIDLTARPAGRRTAPRTPRPSASEDETAAPAKPSETPAGADIAAASEAAEAALRDPDPDPGQPGPAAAPSEMPPPPPPPEPPRDEQRRVAPPPSDPPVPPPPAATGPAWPSLLGAAVGGGLLGVAVAFGLAAAGLWPTAEPEPDPRLARLYDALPAIEQLPALEQRLSETSAGLAGQQEGLAALQTEADGLSARLGDEAARLEALAAAARFDPASLPPPDLSGIEGEISALSARLDALAAGASSEDAAAISQSFAGLETRLASLEAGLASARSQVDETASRLAELAEAPAEPVPEAASPQLQAQLRLPLLLSGIEAAVASGRPFAAELEAIQSAGTAAVPPESLRTAAATGLARPDTLPARFVEALPAIIAAGTRTRSGDWMADALDWGRSLLALRPADERQGEEPDAVLSRLEAAIARRDFTTARDLFARLPQPMQEAAAPLPDDIARLAEAEAFIAALRAAAVAPEAAS